MTGKSSSGRVKGLKGSGRENAPGPIADLTDPNFALPFVYYMTVPKNTAIASPLTYDIVLPKGRITRVWSEFPKGCSGLAGLQLYRGPEQIFPLPKNIWLKSDNAVIPLAFSHLIITEPFNVTMRCYNLDDTYQHVIGLIIEMRGLQGAVSDQMQGLMDFLAGGDNARASS